MNQPARKKVSPSRSPKRSSSKQSVTFEYFDPSATVVTLVGDFNKWDLKARPFKRDAGRLWKVTVRLEPGTYQYKFVVNGERWEEDPLNLHRVLNEHGTFNSIRKVGQPSADGCEAGNDMPKGHDGHTPAG
ncbi:MAG: isoamylase early set domain-containing protein [Nitrospirota bacterium]